MTLVVGAGIAGIFAAILELKKGNNVTLIDSSSTPGGLLKSDVIDGNYFDYGTHIMPETGNENLDKILFGDLKSEDYIISKTIQAGNYYNGQLSGSSCYVDGRLLNKDLYNRGCVELMEAKQNYEGNNLKKWYDDRYGKTFSENIFCQVIEKYIGVKADQLDKSVGWFFDLSRILIYNQKVTEDLCEIPKYYKVLGHHKRIEGVRKYYPKKGGIGSYVTHMLNKFNKLGGKLNLNEKIRSIIQKDSRIIKLESELHSYDVQELIWTIPRSILGFYVKNDLKINRPKFRNTILYDYIFNESIKTKSTFINVYDTNLYSGRITCYENMSNNIEDKGKCTVEVLSNNELESTQIENELKAMGIVNKQTKALFSNKRIVPNGFPIMDKDYVRSANEVNKYFNCRFENIKFCGKASESNFFMNDVLKEVYNMFYE